MRLALLFMLALFVPRMALALVITDVMGNRVELAAPAERIVLAEGRQLAILGLIHPDPVPLVVGWRETRGLDPVTRAAWAERFPALDRIPAVGLADRLNAEAILALRPDLVVLTLEDGLADPAIGPRLASLGIPVIVVDFFAHPASNTVPSLMALGTALGREAEARRLADLWQGRIRRITDGLADLPQAERPAVFIHAHAGGIDCCASAVDGVFDDFIRLAGGRNLAREASSAQIATIRAEWLLTHPPDLYLATGGGHLKAAGGLVIGPGTDMQTVAGSFARMIERSRLSPLLSPGAGQAHAAWHLFNDTPANIALIEYLARALHPDRFADLDPEATLREVFALSPVQTGGVFFAPVSAP